MLCREVDHGREVGLDTRSPHPKRGESVWGEVTGYLLASSKRSGEGGSPLNAIPPFSFAFKEMAEKRE
jgi:hypothetical protein